MRCTFITFPPLYCAPLHTQHGVSMPTCKSFLSWEGRTSGYDGEFTTGARIREQGFYTCCVFQIEFFQDQRPFKWWKAHHEQSNKTHSSLNIVSTFFWDKGHRTFSLSIASNARVVKLYVKTVTDSLLVGITVISPRLKIWVVDRPRYRNSAPQFIGGNERTSLSRTRSQHAHMLTRMSTWPTRGLIGMKRFSERKRWWASKESGVFEPLEERIGCLIFAELILYIHHFQSTQLLWSIDLDKDILNVITLPALWYPSSLFCNKHWKSHAQSPRLWCRFQTVQSQIALVRKLLRV